MTKNTVTIRKTLKMFAIIKENCGDNEYTTIGVVVGEVNNACTLAREYSRATQSVTYVCGYYPMFAFHRGYDIEISDFTATDEGIHDKAQEAYGALIS